MTEAYWRSIGGTFIPEFQAVQRTSQQAQRLIDGLIIPDGPNQKVHWREVDIQGKDIIVIQTKAYRLGMSLLGQALFSRELVKAFNPRFIKTVALCSNSDTVLEPIAAQYGIEVVVMPALR